MYKKSKNSDPRLTILINKELQHDIKLKALKEDKSLTAVVTELLVKWLAKK